MAIIIDYEDQYLKDFQRLNLEWLEKFNLVESHDLEVLTHPRENVIDHGYHLKQSSYNKIKLQSKRDL